MTDFKADLHCHTTCSDGTMTPRELIAHAKAVGLSGLSITDHDTVAAYPDAFESAKEQGIALIPGVEFSTVFEDTSIHVLGYCFDHTHPKLIALCEKHAKRREKRYYKIVDKLKELGMPIQAKKQAPYGRPHIAEEMMKAGYVTSIQEAFHKWLGENKPAFSREEWVSLPETLDAIHAAGGVAIIAHPHLVKKSHVLQALLNMPFDGIECYYARFSIKQNSRWLKEAKKRDWLMTGGSDFHGDIKPSNPLGSSFVQKDHFEKVKERWTTKHL